MLKKILAIILATVLCFCFTACEEEENIYNLIKDNKYFCSIENIDKDKLISIKDIYDKFELFNDINFYDFYIKYIPICIFSFIF